jgi:REP element-mobilizing transposase RayT
MLNHIHLIAWAPDPGRFVQTFKSLTSRRLKANLMKTEPRVGALFQTPEGGFRLWQEGSAPKHIETPEFLSQKARYIHENPVRKQYVAQPDHWFWSSANPHCPLRPDPI